MVPLLGLSRYLVYKRSLAEMVRLHVTVQHVSDIRIVMLDSVTKSSNSVCTPTSCSQK